MTKQDHASGSNLPEGDLPNKIVGFRSTSNAKPIRHRLNEAPSDWCVLAMLHELLALRPCGMIAPVNATIHGRSNNGDVENATWLKAVMQIHQDWNPQ